ncbi:hypothetical protein MH117_02840 [Paenibacillus sp. ACRRX]|uniref:hypothetical protein n=1 Tax=Paenibacillus sp. ACRRX TaxID=2918206 RepID=UPI001EF48CAC|nr:hypothetical protein [Paenibacillus sp. ACRRX]MCG7406339.1 hypothetical protein [Paenibacillus sp. ACRRX]
MSVKMSHNQQQLWISGTSTEIQAALKRLVLRMGTDIKLVDVLGSSFNEQQRCQSAPISLHSASVYRFPS